MVGSSSVLSWEKSTISSMVMLLLKVAIFVSSFNLTNRLNVCAKTFLSLHTCLTNYTGVAAYRSLAAQRLEYFFIRPCCVTNEAAESGAAVRISSIE